MRNRNITSRFLPFGAMALVLALGIITCLWFLIVLKSRKAEPDILFHVSEPVSSVQSFLDGWKANLTGNANSYSYSSSEEIWGARADNGSFLLSRGISAVPLEPRGKLYYLEYLSSRNKMVVSHYETNNQLLGEILEISVMNNVVISKDINQIYLFPRRIYTLGDSFTWYAYVAYNNLVRPTHRVLARKRTDNSEIELVIIPALIEMQCDGYDIKSLSACDKYLYLLLTRVINPNQPLNNILESSDTILLICTVDGSLVVRYELASSASNISIPIQDFVAPKSNQERMNAVYYDSFQLIRPQNNYGDPLFYIEIRMESDRKGSYYFRNEFFTWNWKNDTVHLLNAPKNQSSSDNKLDEYKNVCYDLQMDISYVYMKANQAGIAHIYSLSSDNKWKFIDIAESFNSACAIDVNGRLWYASPSRGNAGDSIVLKYYNPQSGKIMNIKRLNRNARIFSIYANPKK